MRAVIIEDEKPAAEKLIKAIQKTQPSIEIAAVLNSIKTAVDWLQQNPMPDLLFMDIELSDGLSFKMFETVNISSPVIFCTAFDEYWQEAFEHNSIDYLLKPVKQDKLETALNKYDKLKQHFASSFQHLMQWQQQPAGTGYKKRFLVKRGVDYITVRTEDIAYFYATHKLVCMVDNKNQKFILDQSLADIEKQLDPSQFYRVNRKYLQNVLVTISDKKIGVDNNSDGTVDYYTADVITANDYYPFGSQMPGRKYTASSSSYRYGFNGKENDNEVKGEGNQQDYGMRIYDPRLGRFLSVDPLTKKFPGLTPYQFASNKPINSIDLDGGEAKESYQFYDVTGKLTSSYTIDVSDPYGLGSGTLYHVYTIQEVSSKQINQQTVEVQQRTLQNDFYVPQPRNIFQRARDWINGKIPQVMVFGSGKDMSGNNGSEPDYSKPLYSFNFREFGELMELITLGMETPDLKDADPSKVPELTKKLFDQVAEDNPDSEEAKKLKERNGTSKAEENDKNKVIFCRTCSSKYRDSSGVEVTTNKPATDTANGHNEVQPKLKKNK